MGRIATLRSTLALPLFAFAALSGCAPRQMVGSMQVMAPDGTGAWFIDCVDSQAYCLQRAQWHCPAGYAVIDRGDTSGATVYRNAFSWNSTAVANYHGNMTVQCRQPAATLPPAQLPPGHATWIFRALDGTVFRVPPERRDEALRAGLLQVGSE